MRKLDFRTNRLIVKMAQSFSKGQRFFLIACVSLFTCLGAWADDVVYSSESGHYICLSNYEEDNDEGRNFSEYFAKDPNLLGVIQYNSKEKFLSAALHNRTIDGVSYTAAGNLDQLISLENKNGLSIGHNTIDKIKISGDVIAKDICMQNLPLDTSRPNSYLQDDGHYGPNPEGYWFKSGALAGMYGTYSLMDLSEAKPVYSSDINFYFGGFGGFKKVLLPTDKSYDSISDYCFKGFSYTMPSVCIPGNVKTIGVDAFFGCEGLTQVSTTGVDEEGNGDYSNEIAKSDSNSITFSSGLKLIKTGAFQSLKYIKDVYILNDGSNGYLTQCEAYAFSSTTYFGDNGFKLSHPVTRDSYTKHEGFWFGLLHYPANMADSLEKKYTDITREYSYEDEGQITDGEGKILKLPTQVEWLRSFNQASSGYVWNSWDPDTTWNGKAENLEHGAQEGFRATVDGDQYMVAQFDDDEYVILGKTINDNKDEQAIADSLYEAYGAKQSDASLAKGTFKGYEGWHQFVLAFTYDTEHDNPKWDFSRWKSNDWWTICVPFDMTKEKLYEVFGNHDDTNPKGPIVCRLDSVTRSQSEKMIKLHFPIDYYKNAKSDDEVVMHAGIAYLIHPFMPEDAVENWNPADHVLSDSSFTPTAPDPVVPANILSNDNNQEDATQQRNTDTQLGYFKVVTAANEDKEELSDWKYYFIGGYIDKPVPAHAYYLGIKKGETERRFFYQGNTASTKDAWNDHTAIVMANPTLKLIGTGDDDGQKRHYEFTAPDDGDGIIDVTSGTSKPNVVCFFGEGSTATAITNINGKEIPFSANVYNMNGQLVSRDGNLKGLPKGIYIVNGKKYIVK